MGHLVVALVSLMLLAGSTLAMLPTSFTATKYELTLTVPIPTTTYPPTTTPLSATIRGTVVISLTCVIATNNITLHWGTTLRPVSPTSGNFTVQVTRSGTTSAVTISSVTSTGVFLVLLFPAAAAGSTVFVENDVVTVTVNEFSIDINSNQTGLFFYQYASQDQTTSYIIATNFKPSNARNVFPCLDEPRQPATITLTLNRPSSWAVISSLPFNKTTTANSVTTDTFTSTSAQPLSAFSLVMMAQMGRTTYTTAQSPTSLLFWAPRSYTATALSPTMAALAGYYYQVEGLVGRVHPSSQVQIVLVPDLPQPLSGYGVICIRFRLDLYAQNWISPQKEGLFRTTMVPVVREFLRQFTEFSAKPPTTWVDAWVTESITRYLSYALLNSVLPTFDVLADLEVVDRHTALSLDSSSSPPLHDTTLNIDSPTAVQLAITDPLKLAKGAFILSMLDMSFPSGVVYDTIKTFINPGTTSTTFSSSDFYNALRDNFKPFESGAQSENVPLWFTQPGYPQLNVSVDHEGSPGSVSFYMLPFCNSPPCQATPDWYVAATVGSRSDPRYYTPRQGTWVTDSGTWVATNLTIATGDWVVANMKSSGYYRAQYTTDNWKRVVEAINGSEVPGRSQVIDDSFALSAAGRLDYNTSLQLALVTGSSSLYRDWYAVLRSLRDMGDKLTGLTQADTFTSFATRVVSEVNMVLKNASTDAWQKARTTGLTQDWMCQYDVAGWRSAAVGNLSSMLQGNLPSSFPSSSYDATVCCAAQYSTQSPQQLWSSIASTTLGYYGKRFNAIAIGCGANYKDSSALFDKILNADPQLNPHILTIFQYLAEKHPFRLTQNLTTYAQRVQYQLGAPALASVLTAAARKLNNDAAITLLRQVSTEQLDAAVQSAALAAASAVAATASWLTQNTDTLTYSLRANTPAPSAAPAPATPVLGLAALLPLAATLLLAQSHAL